MSEMKGLYIDGDWVFKNETYPLYAPYSGECIANISMADESDVKKAIAGAHKAFGKLKALSAHDRARILFRAVERIKEKKEELVEILVNETGKPIRIARGEIDRTLVTYQLSAEEAKRLYGETIPMDAAPGGENRLGMTWREPIGVVTAITPFNFPYNLVAHKVGPALAVGNTVVLKPAEQTPLSALKMAEIFAEAGLPAGALQVVTGSGRKLSDALIQNERVKKVTFTGSARVGKQIKAKAGLKKVTLELGSNAGLIIEPDVPVEKIIPRCVEGAFSFSGQVCISLQRIYVHQSIFEEFSQRFIERTKQLQVGDPFREETDLSSMIHPRESDRITEWVNNAVQSGARVGCGGKREGSVFLPTVLLDVDRNMDVVCQEAFAPIVTIVPYQDLDEAIENVNDSTYGLNAAIYTSDIHKAFDAAKRLEAGGIIVNDVPTFRVDHMPYGGVKESGYGREGIKYAVQEMTELKFVTVKLI